MKTRLAGCLLLLAMVATVAWAAEENVLEKAKCLVSGKAVSADVSVDYKDAKVYFCCEGCPPAFKEDVAKFAPKANHQLALTKQYKQEKCPFSGEDLNDDAKIEVAGTMVKFCCENCLKKAQAEKGEELVKLVFADDAFKKGFVLAKKEKEEETQK